MTASLVRVVAMLSTLLAIPLALVNWIHFSDSGFYISGRDSDVVFPPGDGYAIAALGALVLLTRLTRTVWPRLEVLFPLACVLCGPGIMAISGAVLLRDWAGERMWTLYAGLVLGIVISLCGAVMLAMRRGAASAGDATAAGR